MATCDLCQNQFDSSALIAVDKRSVEQAFSVVIDRNDEYAYLCNVCHMLFSEVRSW